jgi:hypothetical protein
MKRMANPQGISPTIDQWLMKHRSVVGGARGNSEPLLTHLIWELVLASAMSNGVIARVDVLPDLAFIFRGPAELTADGFCISDNYRDPSGARAE